MLSLPINKWFAGNSVLVAAATLFFITLITYSNSISNGFLLDDNPMLIGNTSTDVVQFLQLDFKSLDDQVYFRPIYHFFYANDNCPVW